MNAQTDHASAWATHHLEDGPDSLDASNQALGVGG